MCIPDIHERAPVSFIDLLYGETTVVCLSKNSCGHTYLVGPACCLASTTDFVFCHSFIGV